MHIDPENLSEQTVHALPVVERITAARAVSDCRIEIAIRTEAKPTGFVVVSEIWLIYPDDERCARAVALVRVGRRDLIAADFRIAGGIAQIYVKMAVLCEVWIEGEAEQTLFADRH